MGNSRHELAGRPIARRRFLQVITALPAVAAGMSAHAVRERRAVTLTAAPARQQLVPGDQPQTEVWSYNGAVPGPELRFRQGERVRIVVENRLPQETTVHWHGLRVPNAMDGVPHVTQQPIAPGGRFVYEFDLPDAGTYWYHPHAMSNEQVARGLYGALVVEERTPIRVDRDVTWVLSDWRLTPDAQLRDDFGSGFDLTHAGRVGNTVTINGRLVRTDGEFTVTSGERIRLRLINAAVARIFALRFEQHVPHVIALDGQGVEPHAPPNGVVVLGPGMRCDLVLDCILPPGTSTEVTDVFYREAAPRLIGISYSGAPRLREKPPGWSMALVANPVPEPDLAHAVRHEILLQGGAMGRLREAEYGEERRPLGELFRVHQIAWAINGVAAKDHVHAPLITLRPGASCVLAVENDTAWHHPLHLHGHFFRIITRNGAPTPRREWCDTALLAPRERAEVAFVAGEPGDWMLHCHILAHQAGGMMGTIRVE